MEEKNGLLLTSIGRNISTERVYKLSDFNTLRLGDGINDLPDSLAFSDGFVSKLRWLMFVQTELDYRRYIKLLQEISKFSDMEDTMAYLEEIRLNSLSEIRDIIEGIDLEYKLEKITEEN